MSSSTKADSASVSRIIGPLLPKPSQIRRYWPGEVIFVDVAMPYDGSAGVKIDQGGTFSTRGGRWRPLSSDTHLFVFNHHLRRAFQTR